MSTTDRWRLVLGRYAGPPARSWHDGSGRRRGQALDFLYGREYAGRRAAGPDGERDQRKGPGSLDDSVPHRRHRLAHEVRELFPARPSRRSSSTRSTATSSPSSSPTRRCWPASSPARQLLATLLALRGQLDPSGAGRGAPDHPGRRRGDPAPDRDRGPAGRCPAGCSQHRHSLDAGRRQLRPARARSAPTCGTGTPSGSSCSSPTRKFFERNTRRLPWEIVLCVDQSGSMVDSVIHSAVMAGHPGRAAVVPAQAGRLRHQRRRPDRPRSSDPVELLHVGPARRRHRHRAGGALRRASSSTTRIAPSLVLVTDFCEGGPPRELVARGARARRGAGHDDRPGRARRPGQPVLRPADGPAARRRQGMHIAALTPAAAGRVAGRGDGRDERARAGRGAVAAATTTTRGSALANRGLLRRASKDLAALDVQLVSEDDDAVDRRGRRPRGADRRRHRPGGGHLLVSERGRSASTCSPPACGWPARGARDDRRQRPAARGADGARRRRP